ncbi:MAG: tRNA-(ms[2]io[6]A)-hydroxylase [Myxococcales bacterium]|nr:tRNA-(ms[2]io[6]A)-hydroxylase [Myxococcales bacterium]
MRLHAATPDAWATTVMADMNTFLLDHASAERKASATALSLLSHFPDRTELVAAMIALAQEELLHFAQVYELLSERRLILRTDERDRYVRALRALGRPQQPECLLDRLLIAGIIEARGCERFGLLAAALPPGDLKTFYLDITRSEARHAGLFVRLARCYYPAPEVSARQEELLAKESDIMLSCPLRARVH